MFKWATVLVAIYYMVRDVLFAEGYLNGVSAHRQYSICDCTVCCHKYKVHVLVTSTCLLCNNLLHILV